MKNLFWIVLLVIVAGLIWWWLGSNPTSENLPINNNDAVEEVDENLETVTLSALGDYTGTGVATRKFVDDTFIHTVSATLPDLSEGKFYEGWIVVPNSEGFKSTGKLALDGDEWKLAYSSNVNELSYSIVTITEETLANGLDNKPEVHILEGRF